MPDCGERLAVGGVDRPGRRLDVGAVDRQRGERPREVGGRLAASRAAAARPRARTSSRACSSFASRRTSRERARVARELLPQLGQRRLAGRVDEERRDVVQELVARRALDRPVAQPLARLEDLLDPDVLGAAVAQPLEVAGRVGEPVGVVDAQPVDERRRATSSSDEPVGRPRTPRGPPTRRPPARRCRRSGGGGRWRRVDVEELARAASGSAQKRLSSSVAMWLGTTSSTMPRPAPRAASASARNSSSPPSVVGDSRRVDHVVAVRRARPGLRARARGRGGETPRSRRYGTSAARVGEAEVAGRAGAGRWRERSSVTSRAAAARPASATRRVHLGRGPRSRSRRAAPPGRRSTARAPSARRSAGGQRERRSPRGAR